MPNYRYNSPDSMQRGRQGCQCASQTARGCGNGVRERANQTACAREERTCEREVQIVRGGADGCCREKDPLGGMSVAMAYVPWQQWRELYEAEKGFCRGTIFCELDKPFQGTGGVLR